MRANANHPNRFMFTGREFDKDTGLYYYRARYYHPEIGRFLQTDPIGYGDGMNWYAYCRNGPLLSGDPFGLWSLAFYDGSDPGLDNSANGSMLKEAANDYDVSVDMSTLGPGGGIVAVITALVGMDLKGLTEVYFFDHCGEEEGSLYFGDVKMDSDPEKGENGKSSMQMLCEWLSSVLPADCTINFRNCYVGVDLKGQFIRNLAQWSQRTVTGGLGPVVYEDAIQEGKRIGKEIVLTNYSMSDGFSTVNVPDYICDQGWAKATYDPVTGQVTTTTTDQIRDVNGFGGPVRPLPIR